MKEYYLTKLQHSPFTLCLSTQEILKLPSNGEENNWVLHEKGIFFMEKPLHHGTIEQIKNYLKEIRR